MVDFRHPEGRELLARIITASGEDAGLFVTNFPSSFSCVFLVFFHEFQQTYYSSFID